MVYTMDIGKRAGPLSGLIFKMFTRRRLSLWIVNLLIYVLSVWFRWYFRVLEAEYGITCNLTLLFAFAQVRELQHPLFELTFEGFWQSFVDAVKRLRFNVSSTHNPLIMEGKVSGGRGGGGPNPKKISMLKEISKFPYWMCHRLLSRECWNVIRNYHHLLTCKVKSNHSAALLATWWKLWFLKKVVYFQSVNIFRILEDKLKKILKKYRV